MFTKLISQDVIYLEYCLCSGLAIATFWSAGVYVSAIPHIRSCLDIRVFGIANNITAYMQVTGFLGEWCFPVSGSFPELPSAISWCVCVDVVLWMVRPSPVVAVPSGSS